MPRPVLRLALPGGARRARRVATDAARASRADHRARPVDAQHPPRQRRRRSSATTKPARSPWPASMRGPIASSMPASAPSSICGSSMPRTPASKRAAWRRSSGCSRTRRRPPARTQRDGSPMPARTATSSVASAASHIAIASGARVDRGRAEYSAQPRGILTHAFEQLGRARLPPSR